MHVGGQVRPVSTGKSIFTSLYIVVYCTTANGSTLDAPDPCSKDVCGTMLHGLGNLLRKCVNSCLIKAIN